MAAPAVDFLVDKKSFSKTLAAEAPPLETVTLQDGEAVLRIDAFAFTANNVTYAAFGDQMQYWNFFPAPAPYGRVPVWGFGEVAKSRAAGVEPGQRYYGYFPMSAYLVVKPERVGAHGFSDGADHRKGLHPVYNAYQLTSSDPGYDKAHEDAQMLLRPLFTTSFLIEDFLADNKFFGAEQVVLSSASSKTAFGVAHLLHGRQAPRPRVVGLTSPANVAFTQSLGCYDAVVPYDGVSALNSGMKTSFVDMAGNAGVRAAVHNHFRDNLAHSLLVGATHWEESGGSGAALPGAKPEFFFAPTQVQKRNADWGRGGLEARLAAAWSSFRPMAMSSLKVQHLEGPEAVGHVFAAMVSGKARPDEAFILKL